MRNYTEAEILALVEANTQPVKVKAEGVTYLVPYRAAQEVRMARRLARIPGQLAKGMKAQQVARKLVADELGVDQTTAHWIIREIR